MKTLDWKDFLTEHFKRLEGGQIHLHTGMAVNRGYIKQITVFDTYVEFIFGWWAHQRGPETKKEWVALENSRPDGTAFVIKFDWRLTDQGERSGEFHFSIPEEEGCGLIFLAGSPHLLDPEKIIGLNLQSPALA